MTNLLEKTASRQYPCNPSIKENQQSTNLNPKAVVIEESSVMIPSQIGFGTTDIGMLAKGFLKSSRTDQPYRVEVNGRTYLVGPNVETYTTPLQRLDFARLGDTPEQRALTYAAIGLTLGRGEHPAAKVVVGFPVEVMKDDCAVSRGAECVEILVDWYS